VVSTTRSKEDLLLCNERHRTMIVPTRKAGDFSDASLEPLHSVSVSTNPLGDAVDLESPWCRVKISKF